MSDAVEKPVIAGAQPTQRIIGYDLARALAIFGMVVVNFKVAAGAETNGPAWLIHIAALLDGRAAATFVVLAGVGISLLSWSARLSGNVARERNTLLRRALFLFVVGLLYTPIWPADILHFYGVYIAVAAFLLGAASRRLLTLASVLLLLFPILLLTLNYDLGWDWETLTYSGFWAPAGMVRHLFFNGFHPVVPWLAFLLLGMALGRLDLSRAMIRRRVFAAGAAAVVLAEVASWFLLRVLSVGESPAGREELVALLGTDPMPPMPLYMLAGAGVALCVIAACVSIGLRHGHKGWLRPLVATGQLALTIYVAHVIVGMGTLEALGHLESQSLVFSVASAGVFCVLAVAFADAWRKRFKRGPLEALMRTLTDVRK